MTLTLTYVVKVMTLNNLDLEKRGGRDPLKSYEVLNRMDEVPNTTGRRSR